MSQSKFHVLERFIELAGREQSQSAQLMDLCRHVNESGMLDEVGVRIETTQHRLLETLRRLEIILPQQGSDGEAADRRAGVEAVRLAHTQEQLALSPRRLLVTALDKDAEKVVAQLRVRQREPVGLLDELLPFFFSTCVNKGVSRKVKRQGIARLLA